MNSAITPQKVHKTADNNLKMKGEILDLDQQVETNNVLQVELTTRIQFKKTEEKKKMMARNMFLS